MNTMHIPVDESLWDWPLQGSDGVVKVHNDDDHFEVDLDASYFTPQDIQVKVIGHNLDIHFEHEHKQDKLGDVSRSISRSYKLPDDVDLSSIKSSLNKGTLIITAAKKPQKKL
ncbi:hypothetical protein PRIPAC_74208 [Pristionchus pacificus]|uniref:SHSP domain-containing protein n=1 Tax=Pristionchus pacificus TaxID=54126 RepID=A0A454Y2J4_PRIPA|nr:hypothetical protein PRIPAC_74208 [Pristionchus pacificus]|eukprot:PDM60827.1 hypothetical protein PRIPAC_54633 [Pristionchus pacificus]